MIGPDCVVAEACTAPRSFFAALPMGWEITRAKLIRYGESWEIEEAITDLRWWEDQIRCRRALSEEVRPRKFMPSERELASWWGWSKQKARRLLDARHTWADPSFFSSPAPRRRSKRAAAKPSICADFRASPGQSRGNGGAVVGHCTTVETEVCADFGATVGQSRGNSGAVVGRHARARSQAQVTQTTNKREGDQARHSAVASSTSSPSVGSQTWTASQVLVVWRDAWKPIRGGNPCRGRQDQKNAAELATALSSSQTSRPAFLAACQAYLVAQQKGNAFPQRGVPMIGHIKRVWREFIPSSRSQPGKLWLNPYNSTPAPIYEELDALDWLRRNHRDVQLIRESIAEHGGGEAELLAWLTPRVEMPQVVLQQLLNPTTEEVA